MQLSLATRRFAMCFSRQAHSPTLVMTSNVLLCTVPLSEGKQKYVRYYSGLVQSQICVITGVALHSM
jgi:hypothetical protein